MLTDSGGYQIFSMGHGSVGDEIKGRRGAEGTAEFGERGGKLGRFGRSGKRRRGGARCCTSRWGEDPRAPTSRAPSLPFRVYLRAVFSVVHVVARLLFAVSVVDVAISHEKKHVTINTSPE